MSARGSTGRDVLHALAVHVLARRRSAVVGRIGLRVTPGGFGTPPFGDGDEVLRVSGGLLIRETDRSVASIRVDGTTLGELAAFAGADLAAEFSAGGDTPPLPDQDVPLSLDAGVAPELSAWWALGCASVDLALAELPAQAGAQRLQLWPEHFDVGTSVSLAGGVNLGASAGDGFCDEPYLYVGPWTDARPGPAGYWNAPFGAVVRRSELAGTAGARAFLHEGLQRLTGESG